MLVELYTSEGCSSCPPADAWLSRLKSHPQLWQRIIPLGFHVDYWNHLGWHDRFAKSEFSNRQRTHRARGNIDAVYTPGFVLDGREWRGFFKRRELALPEDGEIPGQLRLAIDGNDVTVTFDPREGSSGPFIANLAWLGFDLESTIARGENAGKVLTHDFVVLEHHTRKASGLSWTFPSNRPADASAVAAWIAQPDTLSPVQAAGGWLEP